MQPLSIVAFEPWLGGSHARMLETWRQRSRHAVHVLGMPARHWRWRMEAGAWTLAGRVRDEGLAPPDVLFASDYVDLLRLRGFLPSDWASVPAVLYMHENQLTYPAHPERETTPQDASYGFTNVLSCIAADAVVFNSAFHRDDFARASAELLASVPRPRPTLEAAAAIEGAAVIGPGIELDSLPIGAGPPEAAPLRVAFNHRWEHDKDPLTFLRAVRAARDAGAEVELVLLGERFTELPADTASELEALRSATLHAGFAADRTDYARRLGACDVIASTALHEFYGIAVLEGVACGCTPLVPDRLAYPEIVPEEHRFEDSALVERLVDMSRRRSTLRDPATRTRMRSIAEPHDVSRSAAALDALCARIVDPQ